MLNLVGKLFKLLLKIGFKSGGKTLKFFGSIGKVIFIILLAIIALELDANRENIKDLEG